MYKVGFQSTTAVRHFSLAKLTLSQFDQSKNLINVPWVMIVHPNVM